MLGLKILFTLIALILYASLWIPGAYRYFNWKGSDISVGWVSRLGFTLAFGVAAILLVIGAPSEPYKPFYGGAIILGFALAVFGFFWDLVRDKA